MHISSSYAKILSEKLFHTWEIPRSGSKAEDGERDREIEREKERKLVKTMDKLRMAHASMHGARKPPGPTMHRMSFEQISGFLIFPNYFCYIGSHHLHVRNKI